MSEDFKYLGNNPGTQNVPFLDNVNVQKTVTNFNYSLWGASTKIYLKHVPASWSSDYQNVVQFESKSDRDAYFKTNPPITLETEFRIGHDGIIRLPIPYDNLIDYNYLVAEYPDAPVPGYQSNIARKQYFYFIKDCKYISPNTTQVVLELDIWTTYLDEIEIANMQLERGHYPMTLTDVDSYLANPLLNRIGLDTIDVNFGDLCKISIDHQYNLYGDVFYLVATTSDPTTFTKNTTTYNGSSGSNKWHKGLYYFSVSEADWTTWVTNTANNTPAFFQTIKGILVMPATLFAAGAPSFTFNGVTCYVGIDSVFNIDYTFTKEDFGYDSKYQWLTKLYTSPYAVVELLDFNGNKQQIPYEDLYVGKFAMQLFFNIAIANPTARAVVLNIGGSGNSGEFNQIGVDIPIPSMSVNLNPNKKYMFETEYSRIQQQNDINTSFNIAKNNADVTSAVTKRGNDQSKDFGNRDLAASASITKLSSWETFENTQLQSNFMMENASIQEVVDRINKELAVFGAAMGAAAPIAGAGLSSLAAGAGAGLMNPMMIAASLVTAIPGGVLSAFSAPEIYKATWNSGENLGDNYVYSTAYPLENVTHMDGTNAKKTHISNKLMWDLWLLNYRNSWNQNATNPPSIDDTFSDDSRFGINYRNKESQNNDSYTRAETDRVAIYNNAITNANLSKSNSEAAIQNAINQSYLNDNATYGTPGDHSKWANGLMALHYHIKTQSDDAIRLAGDYFLRYGYAYNGNCEFTTFNIMRYYTFWKCKEVWLSSDKVNSNIIDRFKSILERGVTVWRNPADMGNVSIYDNTI